MIQTCVAEGIENITLGEAEEIAIDVGAEEVTVSEDVADGKSIFQVSFQYILRYVLAYCIIKALVILNSDCTTC